jgi:hypothetical protein
MLDLHLAGRLYLDRSDRRLFFAVSMLDLVHWDVIGRCGMRCI